MAGRCSPPRSLMSCAESAHRWDRKTARTRSPGGSVDAVGPLGAPPTMKLFERMGERTALAATLDRAVSGRGSVVVVEGAAGMGKTALIDLTAEFARDRALRVLRARGSEIERDVPLSTLRGLFERHLVALAPDCREALLAGAAAPLACALGLAEPGPIAGAQLHRAVYWLVAQLADRCPLALLVDDLHHADASSLDALAAVARHLDELPVAIVLTRRQEDCGQNPAALQELALAASAPLTLRPLTLCGVGAVLRDRAGPMVDEAVATLGHEATGGNPFLVVQLARALGETSQPIDPAQLSDLLLAVAQSLSAVLRVRVGRLGPDAAMLARVVSVLGDDVSVTEVCAVAGLTREAALVAATALAGAGIFAWDRVNCFAHPLVRAAVEADLLAAERTLLEERAVAVLLAGGADPARTAVHLLRTEPTGDPRAVRALCVAAASASGAAAPARAMVLLRRALAEGPTTPTLGELLGALISAELRAGDYAAAAGHLRDRLKTVAAPADRVVDVLRLCRAVMQGDGIEAAAAVLDDALGQLVGDARLPLEAERLWISLLEPNSPSRVRECLKRYGALPGKTAGERAMLAALAIGMSVELESSDAVAPILERAFDGGQLLSDEGPDSPLYTLAAFVMVACDRLVYVEAEMTRALTAARAQGSLGGVGMALTMRGIARFRLGRICEAEEDGLAASGAAAESDGTLRALTAARALGVVVVARAERGDDAGALGILAQHGLVGDLETDPQVRLLLSRARAHLTAGRAAEALADAERANAILHDDSDVASHPATVISLANTALGNRSAALVASGAQLERARVWRTPSAIAGALRTRGLAIGEAAGIPLLEEAVALLEHSPAALEQAHCLVALGMLRRRTGQRGLALEALRNGADLAQRLGAHVVAQRAREHLLVLGARPRRLAFTGADALTASERRAAQLAAAGHTNREIAQELYLSIKTVESHLGRGFRKLGISSRTELASALAPPSR
jgi:DNA-binding CsgD family transcriptional regulator